MPLGLDHCIFQIKSQGKATGEEEDAYRLPIDHASLLTALVLLIAALGSLKPTHLCNCFWIYDMVTCPKARQWHVTKWRIWLELPAKSLLLAQKKQARALFGSVNTKIWMIQRRFHMAPL